MEVGALGVEGRHRALVCLLGLMMTAAMTVETEDITLVTAHVAVGAGCIFFHDLFVSGVFWMYLQKKIKVWNLLYYKKIIFYVFASHGKV